MSEEALQIAEKRREVKGKGEKEKYTHLDAEFQRIARRDKKAFLSDQCKEIGENSRMEKTRDLFKGTFRLKLKKLGKTTRPFTYDLNQIASTRPFTYDLNQIK